MPVYSTDREILEAACNWITIGKRTLLITVVKTWGSSPRPLGSLMLIREDGMHIGSVSGGCVEEDLLARFNKHQFGDSFPTLINYGVDRAENQRLGLPCGGRLELLIEDLDNQEHLGHILKKLKANALVMRRVCLNTGEVSLHPVRATREDCVYRDSTLEKVFGPRWQLLLIGAGHLTHYVAQIAIMLNYHVIVCDPREDYQYDMISDATERVYSMPDDAVQAYANHPRSIVLALTHDPKLDDMALLDALESPAFYVGAIGSKANSAKRRERLKSLGLAATQLQRLHAPVGLPIGSHSPPEIAVSIMAEITALRNNMQQVISGAISVA